jgi:acylphosphatase
MTENPAKTVLARVTGRVQGVWFRAWTRNEATRLGLTGWVRNEADGSVTAVLSGPHAAVDAMTQLLWHGPPHADVTGVKLEEFEPKEPFTDFTIGV